MADKAKKKKMNRGVMAAVCLAVLVGAGASSRLLIAFQNKPEKEDHAIEGALVEVLEAPTTSLAVRVESQGQVEPRVQIDLVPQVSGKVVSISRALIAGGFFKAGEVLVTIEPTDYELALERAQAAIESARGMIELRKAEVESAKTDLQLEQAEAEVSLAEWDRLHPGVAAPPLVARQPQITAAEARVASAEAQLVSANAELSAAVASHNDAKLDLLRTKIVAPFNGRVMSESVGVGQYVTTGQALATVYGTGVAQIVVPLEDEQLRWFDLPEGVDAMTDGAEPGRGGIPTTVTTAFGGKLSTWQGQAVRTTGQVDPRSRMVHVVIEVDRPYEQTDAALVPGMFVDVSIEGRLVRDLIKVPRPALRNNDKVWVADGDKLRVRDVGVARADRDFAYISSGIEPGERVIVSAIEFVVDEMAIRVRGDEPAAPTADAKTQEADRS